MVFVVGLSINGLTLQVEHVETTPAMCRSWHRTHNSPLKRVLSTQLWLPWWFRPVAGNCWFIAAAASLAASNKALIERVVPPNQGYGQDYAGKHAKCVTRESDRSVYSWCIGVPSPFTFCFEETWHGSKCSRRLQLKLIISYRFAMPNFFFFMLFWDHFKLIYGYFRDFGTIFVFQGYSSSTSGSTASGRRWL